MFLFKKSNRSKTLFTIGENVMYLGLTPLNEISFEEPDLSVYEDDNLTLFNTYTNDLTPTVENINTVTIGTNPLYLHDGAAITSLSFSQCNNPSTYFDINSSNFIGSSLLSLGFDYCSWAGPGFELSDSSNFNTVDSLNFSRCGYNACNINSTVGFTSLTSLSFSYCGYSEALWIYDTAGFDALQSCTFSKCGYYSPTTVNIIDTSHVMPWQAALVLLNAVNDGPHPSWQAPAGTINIVVDDKTNLASIEAALSNNFTVTITEAP